MTNNETIAVSALVDKQREYFNSGATRAVAFRKAQLKKLYNAIVSREDEILAAVHKDLGKSDFEAFTTEIVLVLDEIKLMLKKCEKWAKPERRSAGLFNFPSTAYAVHDPHGVCLIMSPWNYPFQLTLLPLVGAIAAGNTAIVKPSDYSIATSTLVAKLIAETFEQQYVACIKGGREVNQDLLKQHFDYIFFTGSVAVGKLVMESASKFLTPVTLELGGKSPCIIDRTADIDLAAKRAMWGKLINSGQTCVAPDYFLVHQSVKDEFIAKAQKYIAQFYGEAVHTNHDFPHIINRHHFDRLTGLIAGASGTRSDTDEPRKPGPASTRGGATANQTSRLIAGGKSDPETLRIEPAIIDGVCWDDPVMQEEIFGPIIPVISWANEEEITEKILSRPRPLAFYLFTNDRDQAKRMIRRIPFGGGCVNDTIMHVATNTVPFGGTGESGMGAYHGKDSFLTFSRIKSVISKSQSIDIPLRYMPFAGKYKKYRKFL
jgi:aldehyde dehydrogenase (NAD+)